MSEIHGFSNSAENSAENMNRRVFGMVHLVLTAPQPSKSMFAAWLGHAQRYEEVKLCSFVEMVEGEIARYLDWKDKTIAKMALLFYSKFCQRIDVGTGVVR
eukprot:scaffold18439_cov71-Skeletonema_dohrnii-CCMP3373.AAC.2